MKNLEKLVNKKTKVFNEKNGSVIYLTDDIKVVTFDNYKNINGKLIKTNEIGDKDIVLSKLEKIQIKNSIDITEAIKTNLEKIKQASKFVGKDELRPVLNYVYIDKGDVVATDAHTLVKYSNCVGLEGISDMYIHPKVVSLLEDAKSIKYTNRFMYVEFNDYYLIANSNDVGKYPNYNAVIIRDELIENAININIDENYKDALNFVDKVNNQFSIYDNKAKYYFEEEGQIKEFNVKKANVSLNKDLIIMLMPLMQDKNLLNNHDISFNALKLKKIADTYKVNNLNINYANSNKPMLITFEQIEKTKKVVTKKTNEMEAIIKQMAEKIAQLEAQINNQVVTETVKPVETVKQVETVKPKIEIVDYSDKSVMVYGDTKLIKDKLLSANINARFNPFLKLNGIKTPGWIIANKHKSVVEEIISNCAA